MANQLDQPQYMGNEVQIDSALMLIAGKTYRNIEELRIFNPDPRAGVGAIIPENSLMKIEGRVGNMTRIFINGVTLYIDDMHMPVPMKLLEQ